MNQPADHDEQAARTSFAIGVAFLIGAATFWSLNGALVKLIHQQGAGPHGVVIAFYRSLFAGLFIVPLARGHFHTLRTSSVAPSRFRVRPAMILCTLCYTLMTICFVVALTQTEAANAIILQFTSTFWVFGLSPWILHEKPRTREYWILGLALAGVAILFQGNVSSNLIGLVCALASGLFFGLLTLMIRRMRHANSAAITAANNLGSALLIFPVVVLMGGLGITTRSLVLLIVMGVVQFGLPYYIFAKGLTRVPAYQASLVLLLEPILVPVWTYLAVGEVVPRATLFGGGVIFVALILFLVNSGRAPAPSAVE